MDNLREPKRPTDHLPPEEERDADDERTTDQTFPGGGDAPVDHPTVSADTAAEPSKPARHGVAKLPPGPH